MACLQKNTGIKRSRTKIFFITGTVLVLGLTYISPGVLAKNPGKGDARTSEKDSVQDNGRDKDNDADDGDDTGKKDSGEEGAKTRNGKTRGHEGAGKDTLVTDEKRAQYIEETLDYGIQSERIDALNRIKLVKDEAQKKRIFERLVKVIENESDTQVKTKAVYIAGDQKVTGAVPGITKCLDDEDDDTVIAAAYALKLLKGVSAKEKLIAKLKEQDLGKNSNKTEAIIQTLGEFKAKEVMTTAIEAIKNPKTSKINKEAFILYLGNLETPEPKDILLELFKSPDEDPVIRSYAVNSLAKLGLKEVAPEILKVINEIDSYPFKKRSRYYTLYMYCITAVTALGDESVIPRLIESLKSNNPQVRIKSIQLMREIKDKRTIDILKYKMKYDPNTKVRKEAELAIKEIEAAENETKKPQDGSGKGDGKKTGPGDAKQDGSAEKKPGPK